MAIDGELPESESALVKAHVSQCRDCRQKHQELAMVSGQIEALIAGISIAALPSERELLNKRLAWARGPVVMAHGAGKVLRRFGWGMAIAATLAISITFLPHTKDVLSGQPALAPSHSSETFEVDGETFVALPYSNADLPLSAPHIMQMRIPVSSLTAAGVSFEPNSNELSPDQDSVLADVLLGIDGQPLGLHVADLE
ncbi:MAG: anti-sigma factor family protein [Bryobacteraceae bacterium]